MTARCLEIQWHRPGVFSHMDGPSQDWQRVLDQAAAIRLLEVIDMGRWNAIYEVDTVDRGAAGSAPQRRTTQYLVTEMTGGQHGG